MFKEDRDDVEGCRKVEVEAEVLESAECMGSEVCGVDNMVGVV